MHVHALRKQAHCADTALETAWQSGLSGSFKDVPRGDVIRVWNLY